jgi:hypothetical protein
VTGAGTCCASIPFPLLPPQKTSVPSASRPNCSNRRKADIESELEGAGYDRLPTNAKKAAAAAVSVVVDEEAEEAELAVSYDYLLGMALSSLTLERVTALQAEAADTAAAVEKLRATSEGEMWRADLDAFLEAYGEFEAEEARREVALAKQQAKARAAQAKKVGGAFVFVALRLLRVAREGVMLRGVHVSSGPQFTQTCVHIVLHARPPGLQSKAVAKKKGKHAWSGSDADEDSSSDEDMLSDDDEVIPVKRAPKAAPAQRKPPPADAKKKGEWQCAAMHVERVLFCS